MLFGIFTCIWLFLRILCSLSILFGTMGAHQVGFFASEASWGKVLTLDQLKRRGNALSNRCFLRGEGEETVNHLLIHCSKARILWDLLLAIFGVSWVFPLFVWKTLLSWQGSFVGKRHKKAWMTAPLCFFLNNLAGKKQTCF